MLADLLQHGGDAHGAQISTSLEGKLRKYSGPDDIEFVRLACTHAQIDYFGDLPESIETKYTSYKDWHTKRRVPWHGPDVQVEALDTHYLRGLLDDAIAQHVDPHKLQILQAAERDEQELMWRIADAAA